MIDTVPTSGAVIDAANPVNWSHPSMQPGVRPVAWWLAFPGSMGGAKWRDLMSPADLSIGNHGTLANMTQGAPSGWAPTNRRGGFGEMRFDGTDDYISTSVTFAGGTSAEFSISCWVNFAALPASRVGVVGQNNDQYAVCYRGDLGGSAALKITLRNAGGTYSESGTFAPLAGRWYHIVLVVVASSASTMYVDCISRATIAALAGGLLSSSAGMVLGQGRGGYLVGNLDDLRVYNRALSAAEIRQLYLDSLAGYPGVLNRISDTFAAPSGSGLLLYRRRVAA